MTKQFVTFYLGNQLFGVEILVVKEINRQLETTPVQLAPEYIVGLSNLRGQIVTILDPWLRLGLLRQPEEEHAYNIIIKTNAELIPLRERGSLEQATCTCQDPVGIRARDIGDIVEVESELVEAPPANLAHIQEQYLAGIAPISSQLLILLNVGRLLDVA